MKSTIVVVLVVLLAGVVHAEIPQVISYQGKVTDTSGNPVADGSYTMRFRIYDAVTSGTLLWDSGVRTISVAGGIFSVLLGESPQPALDLAFDVDYWLAVTFAGVDQTPRQRMASAGYAYMASGLVPGTEVSGSITWGAAIEGLNTASTGVVYGISGGATATTGTTFGGVFSSASSGGRGVWGNATSSTGVTYGGVFECVSTQGHGVYGYAVASIGNTSGVYAGSLSTGGSGVIGWASSSTGATCGGVFSSVSTAGMGVLAWNSASTGTTYGGQFKSASTSGVGAYGLATATTGTTYGGRFENASTGGAGVYGIATATAGAGYGGRFETATPGGAGVYGRASSGTGTTYGGLFESGSTSGTGLWGYAYAPVGVTYGVYGSAYSTSGYGVYYSGGLAGTGTKSCVVKTSKGPTLMYCQESPENWFEDFGEGHLVNGRCHITLDPMFLETVTINAENPMKVFVELSGKCRGIYVERGATGFDVIEQDDGTSTVGFCYRVVAKRQGFEAKRLDLCEAARTDSYLYPELRENGERVKR